MANTTQKASGDNKTNKGQDTMMIEHRPAHGEDPGGTVSMSSDVVATIAGLAARQIEGIYSLGKPRLIAFGDSPTRGVDAEVGEREAALDLDVTLNYGFDLRETAEKMRSLIAGEVDKMCGRRVVEVNINVHDIHLPEQESSKPAKDAPRVN
jgi:uncharacterized alkaline shock family protein YloU